VNDDPLETIRILDRQGNFNGVIRTAAANYADLSTVKPEVMQRIVYYLISHRPLISPDSLETLTRLPPGDLEAFGLAELLKTYEPVSPAPVIGRIPFPVVGWQGMVREIVVEKTRQAGASIPPSWLLTLDRVGAAVFAVLEKRLGRRCIWRPGDFSFTVIDPYGNEDRKVEGGSMALPLALALYSLVTSVPVPTNVTATGRVRRDGTLEPVESIAEKLEAVRRERFCVTRVLVSDRQEIHGIYGNMEVKRAAALEDAIVEVFPSPPDPASFPSRMDINAEIRALNHQYETYLIDTCIQNAGELITYLESESLPLFKHDVIPALFTCYWKKGSCHCHRGEVKETKHYLRAAASLYRRNRGLIRRDDYFDAGISYAVLLKDIFRYQEAETMHFQLMDEMEKGGCLDHTRGKNLSTLSQLYLAMGRFAEAEQYQRRAMRLINRDEVCRNYGYLARIHTRTGSFQKAAAALSRYKRLLDTSDAGVRAAHTPFYHWIRAEYLYRRACGVRKRRRPLSREVGEIAEKYPAPVWWLPALVHKFWGLACLKAKEEEMGLQQLERVINYFSTRFEPVLRVLGASVRAERAMYLIERGSYDEAVQDLQGIAEDLSLQRDIERFFRKDVAALSVSQGLLARGPRAVSRARDTLERIRDKIPY